MYSWTTEAAASVNSAASSVPDATHNKYGCRYCNVQVNCDNAFTVKVWGASADFAATTAATLLYTSSGNTATGASDYKNFIAPIPGFDYISAVVTNDGVDASTVTVKKRFFN